jgi:ATP-dependent DNA helicase RecQ
MTSKEALEQFFGFKDFRPGQQEIISSILEGKNVLAILPTGGGKSICYQIPALISESFSIVISPLIALMKDQVDSINKKENVAAFINSTLDFREAETILHNVTQGKIKLLYLSPEKIDNKQFAERIKVLAPSYIFVDEAHCISEWGHNFRPSYRKIKQFIEFIGIENISAFTATATEDVRNDILEQLGMKKPKVFIKGFERENLHLNVITTKQKKETVIKLLGKDSQPAIIYAATRKHAEEVCEFLRINGLDAAFYHAGLAPEIRRIIQDDFINDRLKIVAATNAFGMGIDKSDIRTVIHYNIPGNIENYYQEIGRAGRDGKDSNVFLLYDERDRLIQEFFIKNSFPSKEQIHTTYNAICDYGNIAIGFTKTEIPVDNKLLSFLAGKDINKSLAEASIRLLEESGYLISSSEFRKKHFAQFLVNPEKLNSLVKNFTDNELKDLALVLIKEYGSAIFRQKTLLNITRLCQLLNTDVLEISNGLSRLNQSGLLDYEEPSRFPTVDVTLPRIRIEELKLNYQKITRLYNHNMEKLNSMLGYAGTEQCRFNYILNYFGEDDNAYKCGKCDVCKGVINSKGNQDYIELHILETLNQFRTGIKPKELYDILTGASKKELHRNISTFGSCTFHNKVEFNSAIDRLKLFNKISTDSGYIKQISSELPILNQDSYENGNDYEEGLRLFNLLRQIRKEAAQRFNQPPHMICSDHIVREIAVKRPQSFSDMMNINGFNKRIFNKIGEDFINAIKESTDSTALSKKLKQNKIPDNIKQILELVQKKYSLKDIASLTKLPESVVSLQIETLLEVIPELEVNHLFATEEYEIICDEISKGLTDIKLLRESTGGKISYAKIRIALAKEKIN